MTTDITTDQLIPRENFALGLTIRKAVPRDIGLRLMTWSVSLTFFWFGLLKLLGLSPVVGLLQRSFSLFAAQPYLGLLGLFEIAIAIGLLIPRIKKIVVSLTILHLLGTISVVIVAPDTLFAPYFPVLTMEGEFILKNLVLISAC